MQSVNERELRERKPTSEEYRTHADASSVQQNFSVYTQVTVLERNCAETHINSRTASFSNRRHVTLEGPQHNYYHHYTLYRYTHYECQQRTSNKRPQALQIGMWILWLGSHGRMLFQVLPGKHQEQAGGGSSGRRSGS